MTESQTSPESEGVPFRFDCHKSYLHRYIPADGTWVLVNSFGKFVLNFFNDSPPLPQTIEIESRKDGKGYTQKAPKITSANAQVERQYEVSVVLSLEAAKFLNSTLSDMIKTLEGQKEPKEGVK